MYVTILIIYHLFLYNLLFLVFYHLYRNLNLIFFFANDLLVKTVSKNKIKNKNPLLTVY
jgi:hypothetical protein